MTRYTLPLLVLGLGALLLTGLPSQAGPSGAMPLAENETVKLPSGHTIKVLSISKVEYSKGVMALMVRYQTTLSVDQSKAVSEEVDDVWKIAVKDVELYGYSKAILCTNDAPKGVFITASHSLNFIYEKGSDGKWTRLNHADSLVAD